MLDIFCVLLFMPPPPLFNSNFIEFMEPTALGSHVMRRETLGYLTPKFWIKDSKVPQLVTDVQSLPVPSTAEPRPPGRAPG